MIGEYMTDYITTKITTGIIRGRRANDVDTYLGVPYATPPVGRLRYAAPEPASAWSGIRDALEPGPSAPQDGVKSFFGLDMIAVTGSEWRRGDDYLTLNIWTPSSAKNLPVMVYIHGGGLVLGTKDATVYDGRNFARDGVISVNINYRLGIDGFLAIPGAPTNLGLRDMLAGLAWVKENITAFGGDPKNVTVFGESGGGIAVACLLSSPLSKGLFSKAIVQSGHGSAVYPLEIAHRVTKKVAEILNIPADIDGFRSVDAEKTVAAFRRVARPGAVNLKDENGFDPSFGLGVINPIIGDDILPKYPLLALREGAAKDVPLIIGTTKNEANFWFAPNRLILLPTMIICLILRRMVSHSGELIQAYTKERRSRGGETFTRILTDLSFRWPARQYAEAHQGQTYVYDFDWHSPASGGRLGAAHGMDIAFVFDTLKTVTGSHGIAGNNPPQKLADDMHRVWREFASTGSTQWPTFKANERNVYLFGSNIATKEMPLPAAAFYPDPK
jgi:para-nitrobenzyl esterase